MLLAAIITFSLFFLFDMPSASPFMPNISAVYITVVNVVCFFILHWILKREGSSLQKLIGFKANLLGKDILFGLLWLFVLYIPFMLAFLSCMFLMFGTDAMNQFESVFAPKGDPMVYPYWFLMIGAIVSATLFPLLNAPIEELFYRGYAQSRLVEVSKKVWLGILIPAIGFSLQHTILSATFTGAIIYAVAFFFWGLGAGIIYHKQRRLMPLIIAHYFTNLIFGIFPLLFLFVFN